MLLELLDNAGTLFFLGTVLYQEVDQTLFKVQLTLILFVLWARLCFGLHLCWRHPPRLGRCGGFITGLLMSLIEPNVGISMMKKTSEHNHYDGHLALCTMSDEMIKKDLDPVAAMARIDAAVAETEIRANLFSILYQDIGSAIVLFLLHAG